MSRDCCGVSAFCVIGAMRPCTFIEGGTPAVMNKSDAFLCVISLRNEVKSTLLLMVLLPHRVGLGPPRATVGLSPPYFDDGGPRPTLFEDFLVLRVADCLLTRHQPTLDQVLQALIQCLHAVLAAG